MAAGNMLELTTRQYSMHSAYGTVYAAYSKVFHNLADHRSDEWFLMGSPWPVTFIAIFYLYFVKSLGPRLMKDRPAFNLDALIRVYDLLQILCCLYLVRRAHVLGWGTTHRYFCEPVDYSNTEIGIQKARTVWMYFIMKAVDLLDTVFFVLRKKKSQISFLHVYHHALMLLGAWAVVKFLPGGHLSFLGYVNCLVHSVMYMYYFVTSMWPEYRRSIWWKKHITQLQMIQFMLIFLHSFSVLFIKDCEHPRMMGVLTGLQSLLMFMLFYGFYQKVYIKKEE